MEDTYASMRQSEREDQILPDTGSGDAVGVSHWEATKRRIRQSRGTDSDDSTDLNTESEL